jgi:hypothetical protein
MRDEQSRIFLITRKKIHMTQTIIDFLEPFATEREWEILKKYSELGSERKVAEHFGISRSTVNSVRLNVLRKSAKRGMSPEQNVDKLTPEGYMIRGTSTLYDAVTGEAKLQWVKTSIDNEKQIALIQEMVKGLSETIPKAEISKPKNEKFNSDLLVAYPVGDHHFGLLAWGEETNGDDYDTKIAEKLLKDSFTYLIDSAPNSKEALIVLLGDFLHYDSLESVTPKSRNLLDTDTRFANIVRIAMKTLRFVIDYALQKHEKVSLIVEIGNHDPSSSIFLMEAFHHIYQDESRMFVDTNPSQFHYFRFGKNLIGTHHGHAVRKWDNLPLIMANDKPQDWGETVYRYWWTGHVHTDIQKDFIGCRVESFRILASNDAWAHNSGYRSMKDMKCIVLHREYGEIARNLVNPMMLLGAEENEH